MPKDAERQRRAEWLGFGLVFFALYAFATLAPSGATWGIHSLGYFGLATRLTALTICLALLLQPVQELVARGVRATLQPVLRRSPSGNVLVVALGLTAFFLFYVFAIRTPIYGDALTILNWDADNRTLSLRPLVRLLDPHLFGSKETLTLLLHRAAAHVLNVPIGQAYRLLSAGSGAVCLALWLLFLRATLPNSSWSPLLLLSGCLLGANQIYFGHVEVYPFASLTSLAFLLAGYRALDRKAFPWVPVVLMLLAIKTHAAALYFLPALVVAVASGCENRFPFARRLLTWRGLGRLVIVPSLLLGAGLYFFYFRSYHEPYAGLGREFFHSFLPIVPAAPPLDKYTLQSLNHLRDLGNVLLLVGAPVVVVVLGILMMHRRAIDWRHPQIMFATVALAYPLLFFIAVNPALSMPRDWDLYSLLGPPLLVFAAVLLAHGGQRLPSGPIHGTALALGIFSVSFFALNASPNRLTERLEDVGEYVFNTYHVGSSYILSVAQSMDPTRALARRVATVERLAPTVAGDVEYTHLLMIIASMYRDRGDRTHAILWTERAVRVAPDDTNLALWLAGDYLQAHRTEEAKSCVAAVLERDPRNFNALVQGAIAAVDQGDLETALSYLRRASAIAPHDPDVAAWITRISMRQTERQRSHESLPHRGPSPAAVPTTTAADER